MYLIAPPASPNDDRNIERSRMGGDVCVFAGYLDAKTF
jgi:hypothetical protein